MALFAMGQFAECLQPAISKYSQDLIPLLFQNIAKAQANIEKNTQGLLKCLVVSAVFSKECKNAGVIVPGGGRVVKASDS